MLRPLYPLIVIALVACAEAPEPDPEPQSRVVAVADTTSASSETIVAFDRVMAVAQNESFYTRSFGEIVQAVGETLIGTPYRDGLLDVGLEETLVVDLSAFDCVLYVENILALSRGIAEQDYSFTTYIDNLEHLRYRGGDMNGYCSRLHYFTDWIFDNASRDYVQNVTQEIGGQVFPKTLDFMTTHRDAYARLASDSTFACVVGMETSLRNRELFYVPQDRIESVYDRLERGDVIATATNIGGLDVTHTGFVVRNDNGSVGFLHASATGEVKVADDLASYIRGNSVQIGLIVARPVDPRLNPQGM